MVTIYLIPVVITLFYPLILAKYGTVSYPMTLTAIVGFFFWDVPILQLDFFIFDYGKSGYRSGSYLCGIILQFCHEWN